MGFNNMQDEIKKMSASIAGDEKGLLGGQGGPKKLTSGSALGLAALMFGLKIPTAALGSKALGGIGKILKKLPGGGILAGGSGSLNELMPIITEILTMRAIKATMDAQSKPGPKGPSKEDRKLNRTTPKGPVIPNTGPITLNIDGPKMPTSLKANIVLNVNGKEVFKSLQVADVNVDMNTGAQQANT
jgi:hypothetical protein